MLNKLLKALSTKSIFEFSCSEHYLSESSIEVLIRFLSIINLRLIGLVLRLPDIDHIIPILKALKSNYWIAYIELKTNKKINLEIEEFAIKFQEKHPGIIIELNSTNNSIRYMQSKEVQKYRIPIDSI